MMSNLETQNLDGVGRACPEDAGGLRRVEAVARFQFFVQVSRTD